MQDDLLDESRTGAHEAVELWASWQCGEGVEQVGLGVAVEVPLAGEPGPPGEDGQGYDLKLIGDPNSFKALLRAFVSADVADLLGQEEPIPDESTAAARLRPLWVFKLDGRARAQADETLERNASDKDRTLLEWFVRIHESERQRTQS